MTQYSGYFIQRPSARLPRSLALLLLCVFLCARGLVPAGFMPAPLAAGAPYDLCHGDSRSAQLLQWLSESHGHSGGHDHSAGHQHSALTAKSFADNHCNFSASAAVASASSIEPLAAIIGVRAPSAALPLPVVKQRDYTLPPGRAPPLFPHS